MGVSGEEGQAEKRVRSKSNEGWALVWKAKKGVETQEGFVVGFYLPLRFFFYGSSLQTQLNLAS